MAISKQKQEKRLELMQWESKQRNKGKATVRTISNLPKSENRLSFELKAAVIKQRSINFDTHEF